MIKAIIFDAGGVTVEWNNKRFVASCGKALGLKTVKGLGANASEIFDSGSCIGKREPAEDLDRLFGGSLRKDELEKLVAIFEKEASPKQDMIALLKKLGQKYKLALLSNTNKMHAEKFRENDFLELFDAAILSNEVGLVKPNERIFRLALEKLGLRVGECVFIDDTKGHVEAAKKLGFKTIHFRNREQCEQELRKLGVEF